MRLYEVIWKEQFADKIEGKHRITQGEVEDVLFARPHVRRMEKGRIKGEDLYTGWGRTRAGRRLIVFFIYKPPVTALPISAHDMSKSEQRYYECQKESH